MPLKAKPALRVASLYSRRGDDVTPAQSLQEKITADEQGGAGLARKVKG